MLCQMIHRTILLQIYEKKILRWPCIQERQPSSRCFMDDHYNDCCQCCLITHMWLALPLENPNCLQATLASISVNPRSHTVAHNPPLELEYISRRPEDNNDDGLSELPLTIPKLPTTNVNNKNDNTISCIVSLVSKSMLCWSYFYPLWSWITCKT